MKILNPNQHLINMIEHSELSLSSDSKISLDDFNERKDYESFIHNRGILNFMKRLMLAWSGSVLQEYRSHWVSSIAMLAFLVLTLFDFYPTVIILGVFTSFCFDMWRGYANYKKGFESEICTQQQFQMKHQRGFLLSGRNAFLNELLKYLSCLSLPLFILYGLGANEITDFMMVAILSVAIYYPISGDGKFKDQFGGVFICSDKYMHKFKLKRSGRILVSFYN